MRYRSTRSSPGVSMSDRIEFSEQLRRELLRLRDRAGISQRNLAKAIGTSFGVIQRIERNQKPTIGQVEAWLTACNVDNITRQRVRLRRGGARAEGQPWAEAFEGRSHLQDVEKRRELDARLVRNFQPTIIPGLLQTAEYARSVFALGRTVDIPAAVNVRLERQRALHYPERMFEFLITESALRWAPGPRAMVGQAERIASLATLESVAVAVLPMDALPLLPWHHFILNYPADGNSPFVTTELFHGPQRITDPEAVAVYVEVWDRLWAAGVTGDDARELLARHGGATRHPREARTPREARPAENEEE